MKAKETEIRKNQKNPTTNYKMSSHKVFFDRCYQFNKGCPVTGRKVKSSSCTI